MHIQDDNYYPYKFKRFKVTSTDVNGNPLETIFYKDVTATTPVFKWVQEYNAFDVCIDWKIILL